MPNNIKAFFDIIMCLDDAIRNEITAKYLIGDTLSINDATINNMFVNLDEITKDRILKNLINTDKYASAMVMLKNGAMISDDELYESIRFGSDEKVVFLVKNDAPKYYRKETVLHNALRGNNFGRVKYLLDNGFGEFVNVVNDINNTPLNSGLYVNGANTDKQIIALMKKYGARVDIAGGPPRCRLTSEELMANLFGDE